MENIVSQFLTEEKLFEFEEFLRYERGLSNATCIAYIQDLKDLRAFAEKIQEKLILGENPFRGEPLKGEPFFKGENPLRENPFLTKKGSPLNPLLKNLKKGSPLKPISQKTLKRGEPFFNGENPSRENPSRENPSRENPFLTKKGSPLNPLLKNLKKGPPPYPPLPKNFKGEPFEGGEPFFGKKGFPPKTPFPKNSKGFSPLNPSPKKLNISELITLYVKHLCTSGYSYATRARRICTLRCWLAFLSIRKFITAKPQIEMDRMRGELRLPKFLTQNQMQKLLQAVEPKTYKQIRDRAILELLYATGMRVSELTSLKLSNLDLERNLVKVQGKRGKERLIPFGSFSKNWIEKYLSERKGNSEYLFLNKNGKPLTRVGVYLIVKEYLRAAKLSEDFCVHSLRHSFATALFEKGADLRTLQELLGHANITSTQIYTHIDFKRLKILHKKYHPRA